MSYFLGAASAVALAALVYLFLRRSFGNVAAVSPNKGLVFILKRLFPFGLVLPALLGFVSVSYPSCSRRTYDQIVQDRNYLIEKNQEQISSILLSILVAVLIWDLILILVLKYAQGGKSGS